MDLEEIYQNLDILSLLPELSPIKKNTYYQLICPMCGKKEAYIPNKTKLIPVIICNRKNKCAYTSSIWRYLKEFRGLDNKEIFNLLKENAGIQTNSYRSYIPNIPNKFIPKAKLIIEKGPLIIPKKQDILDLKYLIQNFFKLDETTKFMTIVTLIYKFSLNTNQTKKYTYYKSRKITPPTDIGALNLEDFNNLTTYLSNYIPLSSLHYFNIFKNNYFKYSFDNFSVIPSFDLFTNLISAIRLRRLSNKKPKEIEVSFNRIATPLPYPLTYKKLKTFKEFYLTEGHIDTLSLNIPNAVGVEGVNSLDLNKLHIFKNKTIYIAFDQDKAGKEASKKLSIQLNSLNIKNYIITFTGYKDINEIIQDNKNPFKLFKIN